VQRILDLIVPPRCALCLTPGPLACAACLAAVPLLAGPRCARCGRPTVLDVRACRECRGRRLGFATARAAIAYEGAGRDLVHRLKAGGLASLAVPAAGLVAAALDSPAAAAVTWVPPDPWREVLRGYHPPRLLAAELASRWSLPAAPMLRATGPRRPQRGLDRRARRANVRGAFAARGRVPSRVVLVDDVFTTGATLSAAATALRAAGARQVHAVTLARAVAA
jgi:predicted amidophosphoribosyltransferase